ncbi:ATP-binding cassette sub-family G member 8 isoform X2 [Daktulosphaira vitifoliae]|uniref:ATP-binding cassette sub-family G member 8 isoform X2 n=1 Tax=Daktulosphaira vitifoliae TaxID=58002 RepID=UPI0021AA0735|nr:ATP-binding cassette sub-family G member 8 isoform X2 [Daktulosphaira vitifoliae]
MPGPRRFSSGAMGGGGQSWEMGERRYSVAGTDPHVSHHAVTSMGPPASEDLHAWSIYRQNLNSDFTDSALGSSEKSPLPYGNFQLRESTVQSILSHPRYGPKYDVHKSPLGSNMYTYLKFGLPRVFPPNSRKDGSSGYDSSDDGGGPVRVQQRPYTRTRSDPDFCNHTLYHGGRQHPGRRGKSISEANLLAPHGYSVRNEMPTMRRSVHDLRAMSDMNYHNYNHPHHYTNPAHHFSTHRLPTGRPASIAVVGTTATTPRDRSISMMSNLSPNRSDIYGQPSIVYPYLQVRGLEVPGSSDGKRPKIQGISFEVQAGEVMAFMMTSEREGEALLSSLANRHPCHVQHILLNGQNVSISTLANRTAYIPAEAKLAPNLSVAQTLAFYSHLRKAPARAIPKVSQNDQMSVLIEELGLGQVLNTNVSELTASEVQRLSVACHLMSDAEIIMLDRPTVTMDIFDTFFLVEFLRQWAAGAPTGVNPRIVIVTLQPPTYEIFTMVSRVALISVGHLMYSGRRRNMLPYFSSADYPCPAFKNPSDYYLDLVTLDDLSAEAMLESSQRVEQLADLFRRRVKPLPDPGPPQPLPGKPRTASVPVQVIAIILRHMAYSQPRSSLNWIFRLFIAGLLSVIIGAIFWDIPATDPQLLYGDRLGFYYSTMIIGALPLILHIALNDTHGSDRNAVESDISDNLYSRFVYIVTSILCSIPPSAFVWIVYSMPAYAMSALYQYVNDPEPFFAYILYIAIHMSVLQLIATAFGYLMPDKLSSSIMATIAVMVSGLMSGVPLNFNDLKKLQGVRFLSTLSPTRYLMLPLLQNDHAQETLVSLASSLVCRNKQVQHQDIIVQLPCPTPNGTAALIHHGLLMPAVDPYIMPHNQDNLWAGLYLWGFFACISIILFTIIGRFCNKLHKKTRLQR